MSDFDDVIPGDGQPAGQGQLADGYVPNEWHDRPTMMEITVYARVSGSGSLSLSLDPQYRVELGNVLAPEGTTPHHDLGQDFLVIPGREAPLAIAFAVMDGCGLNQYGLKWTGPTPKS